MTAPGDSLRNQGPPKSHAVADALDAAIGSTSTPSVASLTAASITDTGLTASQPVVTDGSKVLTSQSYPNFKASLAIANTDVSGLGTMSTQNASAVAITGGTIQSARVLPANGSSLSMSGGLFDHYTDVGNSGTAETDLYSDTLPGSIFAANGDKLDVFYAGTFVSSGTATRQVILKFNGVAILDTGALTVSLSSAWTLWGQIIRESSSIIRCSCSLTTEGAALAAYTSYTRITGLTLSNAYILKITGTAQGVGAASNDILAKQGSVVWTGAV